MQIRVIRLVEVTLKVDVPHSTWTYDVDEVRVHSMPHPPIPAIPGTVFILAANLEVSSKLPMRGTEILIPDQMRHKLESAIEYMADILSVTHQSSRSVSSILPYIAIDPLDEEAREWVTSGTAIHVQSEGTPDRTQYDCGLDDVVPLLTDRLDGAALLAEALCQEHSTGRLHEFMRVFERAFAQSAGTVCRSGSLLGFLQSMNCGYDATEIHRWLELRDLATHADRKPDYAVEADTRKVVNRMEQAAYDVLFNKSEWRSPTSTRRNGLKPIYGSLKANGMNMFKTQAASIKASFALFDGFSSYPLNIRFDLRKVVPPNWLIQTSSSEI